MENQTGTKLIFRLTWFALVVSVISLFLVLGMGEARGDTSLGLWFVLFLLLLFVSLPLHSIVLIGSLIQLKQGNGSAFRWVYIYLIVAISGHIVVAANLGAFESLLNDIVKFERFMKEPAQVKLEHALRQGPSSNINDVREALASGADPNVGIEENRIPFLVLAASRADTTVIEALLDAGANPNRRASIDYGLSFNVTVKNPLPLDVVTFSDNKGVLDSVKLLLAAGADPAQSIMKLGACRRGDLSLYDLAKNIGAGGLLDAKDQNCLHHAAATNQVEFLQALLFDHSYENENAKKLLAMNNRLGQYPLDVAVANKYFQVALLFVKAGGRANKSWTVERVLGNQSNAPSLEELKASLLRDQPE